MTYMTTTDLGKLIEQVYDQAEYAIRGSVRFPRSHNGAWQGQIVIPGDDDDKSDTLLLVTGPQHTLTDAIESLYVLLRDRINACETRRYPPDPGGQDGDPEQHGKPT